MNVNIGKGITLEVDELKLPSNVVEHIVYIGLRNVLMDTHAAITKNENPNDYVAKSRAVAEAKLQAMYNGEVRVNGERQRLDPVDAEARRIALGQVQTQIKAGVHELEGIVNRKVSSYTTAQILELITKRLVDNPNILKVAKRVVADRLEAE